jgi:hypothetical protein
MELADWTYINAHYVLTPACSCSSTLRRNDSFYFVRNMFMIAMAIALVGYACSDGAAAADARVGLHRPDPAVHRRHGRAWRRRALLNLYAAVPSMHVCFALMIGWPMSRLSHRG